MEEVRLRSGLTDPSFTCTPPAAAVRGPWAYQYQPAGNSDKSEQPEQSGAAAHDAQPPQALPLVHPNPANFAALRCTWTHPAVINLVMGQGLPGVSLPGAEAAGAGPASVFQLPNLWNSMLPTLAAAHYPVYTGTLTSLTAAGQGAEGCGTSPATLAQPNICVGYQDDWLELSPAMLPLWPTIPFEPYAGQKPVQYLVLCPDALQSQALLFIKDVSAYYELCNLGSHHPAATQPWLYTYSTTQPPEGCSPGAWQQLSERQRLLVALRAAAERLQRVLLTSGLQLRQEGPALEVNLGSAAVIYVACPQGCSPSELEAALVEVACCLAPCTPEGADATTHSSPSGSSSHPAAACAGVSAEAAAASKHGQGKWQGLEVGSAQGEPTTPDPGLDRHAGIAADGAAAQPGAAEPAAGAVALAQARDRYRGAAECLFEQEVGDCQRAAQQDFPRGRAPPLDLTLQVVGPQCLSDLSGQAAKAMAFELYAKIRRRPQDPCLAMQLNQQGVGSSSQGMAELEGSAMVPFCSEPLFTLAQSSTANGALAQQQQQQQQQQQSSSTGEQLASAPAQPPRTLHCCYTLPVDLGACTVIRQTAAPGAAAAAGAAAAGAAAATSEGQQCSVLLVPAAWTDSCGELLHCEVLEVELAGQDGLEQRGGLGLGGTLQRAGSLGWLERTPQALACAAVLQRCVELLGHLRATAHPPNLLQHVVVARLGGLQGGERAAWEGILHDRPLLLPVVSSSHHVAVVGLEARPPARLATASGLPGGGGRVSFQHGPGQQVTGATVVMLPGDAPGSLTLPGEHDTVRALELEFVGAAHGSALSIADASSVAAELYALSALTLAHFNLLWGSVKAPGGVRAMGGGSAPKTAHLPLHAYLVWRMQSLTSLLCARGSSSN